MTDKMTDKEIVKALKYCISYDYDYCEECPYRNNKPCQDNLIQDAIDIIKRQQAEIEMLKDHNKQLRYDHKQITSEAIKEFAERLKENGAYNDR